jgi:hypothetical protein
VWFAMNKMDKRIIPTKYKNKQLILLTHERWCLRICEGHCASLGKQNIITSSAASYKFQMSGSCIPQFSFSPKPMQGAIYEFTSAIL